MDNILLNVFTGTMARRSELPTNGMLPGVWPKQEVSEINGHQAKEVSRLVGQYEDLQQTFPSSSQNSPADQYFDSMSRQGTPPTRSEESGMPSYLPLETDTSITAGLDESDWRYYGPPRELMDCQANSSREIKDILKDSIERIKARHDEEADRLLREMAQDEVSQITTSESSRLEIPLPQQATYSPSSQTPSQSNVSLVVSSSSFDSGYISEPKAKTTRSVFGFGMFFRNSQKSNRKGSSTTQMYDPGNTAVQVTETESLTLECVSCLDDFTTPEMIKLICHSYCKECFQRLISTALESETHWPAKCCLNTIPTAAIIPHLDASMKRTYKGREDEWSIPVGDRMYCSQPNCSTWIAPKHIKAQTNTARCPTCKHDACVSCRGPSHGMAECPQDPSLQMTNDLASIEGWKRCYQCRAYVEHNAGCRHITCLCKAQFCYICTKKWKTCACTDADLAVITQRANNIRQEIATRTARETAEAEEVRLAIQMVEEFERAETARIVLETEAEARRQEEARQKHEEKHILAVNRLYSQLDIEIGTLHAIQRVRIAERHEVEGESMMMGCQDALDNLSLRQANELRTVGIYSEMQISKMETNFNQEYQLRLTEERSIEDAYVDQLNTYWTGRPEAEYRIWEARDELRREQDNQYQTWNGCRRAELQILVDDEHRKMRSLRAKHASESRVLEGNLCSEKLEWNRKKWAENQWIEEVVSERATLLQEKEQEEYTRGA